MICDWWLNKPQTLKFVSILYTFFNHVKQTAITKQGRQGSLVCSVFVQASQEQGTTILSPSQLSTPELRMHPQAPSVLGQIDSIRHYGETSSPAWTTITDDSKSQKIYTGRQNGPNCKPYIKKSSNTHLLYVLFWMGGLFLHILCWLLPKTKSKRANWNQ